MKLYSHGSYLDLSSTNIMGILNVTPDSFFDGGKYTSLNNALKQAEKMINAGATIIDIGGESTRPGFKSVSVQEELQRVIPIIENILNRFEIWISIDTSKLEVIRESILSGVHMINDVRSLSAPGALEIVANANLPVCIMHHNNGNLHSLNNIHKGNNLIKEVDKYFINTISNYEKAGIKRKNILLDPGFGFSKNCNQNYTLLANISKFHHFKLPILVGMSRKSMIGELLNIKPSGRLIGSVTCALIAAMQRVQIIRVHDVKQTVDSMRILKTVLNAKGSYIEKL